MTRLIAMADALLSLVDRITPDRPRRPKLAPVPLETRDRRQAVIDDLNRQLAVERAKNERLRQERDRYRSIADRLWRKALTAAQLDAADEDTAMKRRAEL